MGSGIGYNTLSCKICCALALTIAGGLTGLGYLLQVI
jgi:hypothetical protein